MTARDGVIPSPKGAEAEPARPPRL